MSQIPKAPITRIMKDSGAERISDDAKDAMTKHLENIAHAISVEANKVAKIAKRKTIKKEDVDLAVKNLKN